MADIKYECEDMDSILAKLPKYLREYGFQDDDQAEDDPIADFEFEVKCFLFYKLNCGAFSC